MGSTVVHLHSQRSAAADLSLVAALAVYEAVLPRARQPAAACSSSGPTMSCSVAQSSRGILLEREGDSVVVGIGVNLAAAPQTRRPQDALRLADFGPAPMRDAFAADLAAHFDRELGRWRQLRA